MKIQDGVSKKINLMNLAAGEVDSVIEKFDKFQSIISNFKSKYPPLTGSEKQIKWAENIRDSEVFIAAKMIFAAIYQRELKKADPAVDILYTDERINKIGNDMMSKIKKMVSARQWIDAR